MPDTASCYDVSKALARMSESYKYISDSRLECQDSEWNGKISRLFIPCLMEFCMFDVFHIILIHFSVCFVILLLGFKFLDNAVFIICNNSQQYWLMMLLAYDVNSVLSCKEKYFSILNVLNVAFSNVVGIWYYFLIVFVYYQ